MDEIEKFNLKLNVPNLFSARYRINDLSKEVNEVYNIISDFRIILNNKLKQIKLIRSNLEDNIALASNGAAKYAITYYKNGRKIIFSTYDKIIKKEYRTRFRKFKKYE